MKTMAATNQESRLHGLKFFLFDVSVVVCIAAALLSAFRDVDLLSKTRNGSPSCAQPTPASNAPVPEPTPPETSAAGESRDTAAFPAGTLVEDRGRPAVVRAIEEDRAGDVVYSVTGLADSHITRTSSVRPYRAHESGTAALCHVERDLDAEPVPCTVMSTKGSGFGLGYEVHWATEADERHVVLPMSRVLRRAEPPTPPPPTVAGAFPVGSVVELKGSSFPSVVTGVEEGGKGAGGNVTYFLTNAIWDVAMPGVDGYFVQPYHAYESGTAAHCNVERRPRVRLVPCTVVSHVGSDQDMTYKVVARTPRGREREMMLSVARVQRESREETRPAGRE